MAKDNKTVYKTFDCKIYYPQVFEENRDTADMHSETDGVYKVTMGITPEQKQELIEAGVPEIALGYDTFKERNIDGEQVLTYVAKRPHISKYLKDEVTGDNKLIGPPIVFDYKKAVEAWQNAGAVGFVKREFKTDWTMEDGLIGNGTHAKVKLSIYRGKNKVNKPTCVVTLEEIAIVDLVEYTGDGEVRF